MVVNMAASVMFFFFCLFTTFLFRFLVRSGLLMHLQTSGGINPAGKGTYIFFDVRTADLHLHLLP